VSLDPETREDISCVALFLVVLALALAISVALAAMHIGLLVPPW
jgi:hypothetical protein